jgi:glycosyltransferase involved in cell wall biosynthesis
MPVTISALITTRDRPRLLADALASVARQTRAPLETRIADDGDLPLDPGAVGEGLLDLRVLRSDARNAAGARNLVAREARGDVLAFLDDDDLWLAGHLEGLASAFEDPAVSVAYRDSVIVRESLDPGGRTELERRVIAHDWDEDLMRHDDFIAPSALAVRRTLFERLGGFDPSFRYSEDWDFLLRAARLSRPRRVPGITAQVRLRDDNASANRGPERRECLDRLSARHGLPALTIKTFWEVAEAVADSAGGAPASDSAARARARSRS